MKKDLIKVGLISGIVGSILCGGIGSVVAYNMGANQIEYTPKNSGWKVNSVSEAIDSLYISKAGDFFSNDEQVVGTWMNGKPLYQKTITINYTGDDSQSYNHNIANVDLIYIDGGNTFLLSGNMTTPFFGSGFLNGTLVDGWNKMIQSVDRTNVVIRSSSNAGGGTAYITLRYTKTTDTVPNQNQEG